MADKSKSGALKISSREELRRWLERLPPARDNWASAKVAIAARAALRATPLVGGHSLLLNNENGKRLQNMIFASFFAGAVARATAKYPTQANALPVASAAAGATAAVTKIVAARIADGHAVAAARAAAAAADATTAATFHVDAAAARVADAVACAADAYSARVGNSTAIWTAVSDDANFIISGGTAQSLASQPLWPDTDPFWADDLLRRLQVILAQKDDWQVWLDCYERRVKGLSDPEEVELVFATVPEKERNAGPAAANRWIKERLEAPKAPKEDFSRAGRLIKALEGPQQKETSPPGTEPAPPPQPIENLPSPFTFGRNTAGQITIVAGPQNTPVIAFPGDDATHRRWLETGRKLTERLIADLRAGKFHNVRSDYREGLERYISDLPPEPGAGNFLLADAEARMLHSLFAAEPHILAEPFAARLKTVLENHFALLGFYPEVARYLAAAREGQVTAPLPQEAIAGFGKVIIDNTPQAFTPEVSQGLREAEREAPKVELEPEDIRGGPPPVKPPAYPYDEPDPEKSRAYAMMSTFNALYKTVLETAKNEPSKIVNWIAIEEMLRPYAIKIIELLKTFTPSAF